ncbi:hypothetical protein H7849_25380 [Alloacidobacterium dinghuense]|uniref:Uracil-DNA glycosylase-like domain-containing protein n=1 Tax=Alloacidobacterium dinghuense TaxID=2763107 RepID=A0A7G8BIA7_9BACT|nr:uracil-DNA glycosylase family protein [Alloacidobacterium dinghuense]QNI32277.1 hypothetical protein H7849_25380 [Alloacidobacterium dinghuense]
MRKAGLPGNRCFFTNAFLGLRTATKTTGVSPGAKELEFRAMCREFLAYQLEVQKPTLIVCLGHEPRKFIAPTLLNEGHVWTRDISFTNLDRMCDPIVRGAFSIGQENMSPLMVTVAHPSFAWSTHAQSPRSFEGKSGQTAEFALLTAAWKLAN